MDPRAELSDWATKAQQDPWVLIRELQGDIIASPRIADPAFGKKKSIYTDFFASSKPLRRFESIMMEKVLPFYANTHTSTTSTSKSTSSSVKRAREIVAQCTNAITTEGHEHQAAVIFSGDGSTSAINKIRNVFRLGDEAYWTRRISTNNDSEDCALVSTVQHLNVPSYPHRPVSIKSSSSTTSPASRRLLPETHRPVVFISIQEHHSNLLPWRESCADVIVVPENGSSQLDLVFLEEQLVLHQHRPLKIGSFSAGSNLTGVLNDTVAISELLHKYGAFAFYDYAGVGPYTTIDMNPPASDPSLSSPNLAYKDGVFISTHKFLGGPGASGLLVARLEVFSWTEQHRGTPQPRNNSALSSRRSSISVSSSLSSPVVRGEEEEEAEMDKSEWLPTNPGGGTVDMVIQGRHKYTNNILAREEAGTPNILATIRTGLVFMLQEIVRPSFIIKEEYRLAKKVLATLLHPALNGAINVLGNPSLDRVAVFSLTVSVPKNLTGRRDNVDKPRLQIHYALLSTIMNDFFGIEMRGGCMCAGPYASQLLKFDAEKEIKFWNLLLGEDPTEVAKQHFNEDENDNSGGGDDQEEQSDTNSHHTRESKSKNKKDNIHQHDLCSKSLKPGFVRFSFSYFAKDKDVDFVIQSLHWVATYGYLLVPLYKINAITGEWTVRPAVQKAVLAEVAPRRLFFAMRENCIPVAVDCIRALAGLFQERIVPSTATAMSMDNQAKKSLLGSAFTRAFSKASMSATESSISLVPKSVASPGSDGVGDGGKAVASPQVVMYNDSSDEYVEEEEGEDEEEEEEEEESIQMKDRALQIQSQPASSLTIRFPRTRKLYLFSAVKQFRGTDPKIVPDALEELSWDTLQQELDSIEITALAKELRWFVTPLEVARVYEREVLAAQAEGESYTSLFPK